MHNTHTNSQLNPGSLPLLLHNPVISNDTHLLLNLDKALVLSHNVAGTLCSCILLLAIVIVIFSTFQNTAMEQDEI